MIPCSLLSGIHEKSAGSVGNKSQTLWLWSKVTFCFCLSSFSFSTISFLFIKSSEGKYPMEKELICKLKALDTARRFPLANLSWSLTLVQPLHHSWDNTGCWLCGKIDIVVRTYGRHWSKIATNYPQQPPLVCHVPRRCFYNEVSLHLLLFCPLATVIQY